MHKIMTIISSDKFQVTKITQKISENSTLDTSTSNQSFKAFFCYTILPSLLPFLLFIQPRYVLKDTSLQIISPNLRVSTYLYYFQQLTPHNILNMQPTCIPSTLSQIFLPTRIQPQSCEISSTDIISVGCRWCI